MLSCIYPILALLGPATVLSRGISTASNCAGQFDITMILAIKHMLVLSACLRRSWPIGNLRKHSRFSKSEQPHALVLVRRRYQAVKMRPVSSVEQMFNARNSVLVVPLYKGPPLSSAPALELSTGIEANQVERALSSSLDEIGVSCPKCSRTT
ncbi:hypothetical protein BKA63DRAFT_109828 [Paraphoma chrysanthemicola]|nr:hypothetical protein BKA63DRAFT_109828 [Paraphoma chrysanthemicola]